MNKSFSFKLMIFGDDVDSFGIVHHANYLKYLERARLAWLLKRGFRLDELMSQGILFVIRNVQLQFLQPARLYDELEIISEIKSHRRTAKCYEQRIRFEKDPERIICNALIEVVCVNEQLRPRLMPRELVEEI